MILDCHRIMYYCALPAERSMRIDHNVPLVGEARDSCTAPEKVNSTNALSFVVTTSMKHGMFRDS